MSEDALRRRIPLWTEAWRANYDRLRSHPAAPAWNTECGDRQGPAEAAFVNDYARLLATTRLESGSLPGPQTLDWVDRQAAGSLMIQRQLHHLHLRRRPADWWRIPTLSRRDLQFHLTEIVPHQLALDGLIVNPTSGTTGQPIPCPSHIRAAGCYEPLILFALAQHGLRRSRPADFGSQVTAAIQVCHQQSTITYATVHSWLGGAGFAKVNLHPAVWPTDRAQTYLADLAPIILSGDPYAFFQMRQLGLAVQPEVVLSTALALPPAWRADLEAWFQAPICDLYSSNETGPLAFSVPGQPEMFELLPPDVFVELLDPDGRPVADGERGEITVTGGRNPFLPLVRYRTGDYACWAGPGPDGRPRLTDLWGRTPVVLTAANGTAINPIDVSRIIQGYAVAAFQFSQYRSGDCQLQLEPGQTATGKSTLSRNFGKLRDRISHLLGGQPVYQTLDLQTKGGKVVPFRRLDTDFEPD